MRKTILLSICLFVVSGAAQAFDLKGIELDHAYTNDDIQSKLGYDMGFNLGNSIKCLVYCSGRMRIGGSIGSVSLMPNHDGTIGHINVTIDAVDFASIEALLVDKFGKPSKVTHLPMQNAMGVKLNSKVDEWSSSDGQQIQLFQYIDLQSGSLSFDSAKNRAEDAAFRKARGDDKI